MRPHTTDLDNVLTDSHNSRLLADVFHGPDRVMQNVELTDWEIDFDLSRDIKLGGSATIAYQSVNGESLVPDGTSGVLSPFRARLLLRVEVTAGAFTETIVLGWARLVTVPSGEDLWADTRYGPFVVASVVEVEFLGLEENVRRRGFRSPEQPPALGSTYTELRRITGMTVTATVSDKPIPSSITYDTNQGGRLKATQALWDNLDCIGVINPSGAWVGVSKTAGDPVGSLNLGELGTVVDIGYQVDTDTIYNCVVGTFEDADRRPLFAVAEELRGPLATSGLYGENTLYYSSDLVKTQTAADDAVRAVLSQTTGGQSYQVSITCLPNPVVEVGDVLTVNGWTKPMQGRLVKCRLAKDRLMEVTLEVQRSFSL